MFFYKHKNSDNFFISAEKIAENFLQNLDEYEVFEYSDEIKNPILQDGEIIEKPIEETPAEKFTRIFSYLANPENPLEKEKLEGVNFNDEQIGDLILHRVFGGNPHAQTALQTKIIGMIMSGKQNLELIKKITEKQVKLNEVRVFFGLDPITF